MNLYFKFAFLGATLVITTALGLFYFSNRSIRESLKSQIIKEFEAQASFKINNIDRFVQQRKSDIQVAALNPILRSRTRFQTDELNALLKDMTQINYLYTSYSFFDTNRVRIADSRGLDIGKQHSLSNYWKQVNFRNPNGNFYLDFSVSESIGKAVVHCGSVVYDYNGKPTGFLVSRILVDRLYDVFIENIKGIENHNSQITLLDEKGHYLYSSQDPVGNFKKPFSQFNYSEILNGNKSGTAELGNELFVIKKDNGYLNYKGKGWVLIFSVPLDSAFHPLIETQKDLLIALIVIVVSAVMVSFWAARIMAGPIKRLTETAKEIASGNLEASFLIRTRDELETLGLHLQKMARNMRFRLEEKTRLSDELLIKNRLITDSIRFAKEIQSKFLPESSVFNQLFSNHFVLFLPKDIVSGDFYYLHQRGGKIFFAIGDCTGHGVPGALMMMKSFFALSQVIETEGIENPGEIISRMQSKLLPPKQEIEENDFFSGFDIGICVIDNETSVFEFAGLGIDLILWRDQALQVFSGQRRSHSSVFDPSKSAPSTIQMEFSKGNRFLMATDGLKDQIGGPASKKLLKRNLEKKIRSLQNLPLEEQKIAWQEHLNEWMAFENQLDDITLVGIEI